MPYMKEYTAKDFEGMAEKQGDMNPVPDGMLYREPLENDLLGSSDVNFVQCADVPTEPGSKHLADLTTIMKLADDTSIYG